MKQLMCSAFQIGYIVLSSLCIYHSLSTGLLQYHYSAVQSQKAVSAYFTSEQILPFAFADHSTQFGIY